MRKIQFGFLFSVALCVVACGGSGATSPNPESVNTTAGGAASGGDAADAGSSQLGSTSGGTMASGGTSALAQTSATGGTLAAGGATTSGGAQNVGGKPTTGGNSGATGGAVPATGGSRATGSATSAGGAPSSGGSHSTGGASPTGGVSGTGGNVATGGAQSVGGASSTGGTSGIGGGTSPEPAVNFKGFNWADQRDNFVAGILYVSGLTSSSTNAQAQALAEMVIGTWKAVGANTVRLPLNPQTVSSPFWSVYKGVIDKATSMGFKAILCPWTSDHSQKIEDMNAYWTMWSTVTTDYAKNPLVYFELMNEVSYDAASWRKICADWLGKYPTVPKGRVIIPGCGKHGERNSNQMGGFPEFAQSLLAIHLYNPWDSESADATAWYNLADSQIKPYGDRTIVTEYGQSMTTGVDYMSTTSNDPLVAYLTGLSKYMREHKMGGTHWVGLRDGDSWGLYKRNGTTSMTLNNASGLERIKYSWGL